MSRARIEKVCAQGLQQATLDMVEATTDVAAEIAMERALQDHQWGGPEHDDQHTPHDWAQYIHNQLSMMFHREGEERDRFIKVAALATAAVQSIDRKNPQVCDCPACALERQLASVFGDDVKVQVVRVDGTDGPGGIEGLLKRLLSGGKVPPGAARG